MSEVGGTFIVGKLAQTFLQANDRTAFVSTLANLRKLKVRSDAHLLVGQIRVRGPSSPEGAALEGT